MLCPMSVACRLDLVQLLCAAATARAPNRTAVPHVERERWPCFGWRFAQLTVRWRRLRYLSRWEMGREEPVMENASGQGLFRLCRDMRVGVMAVRVMRWPFGRVLDAPAAAGRRRCRQRLLPQPPRHSLRAHGDSSLARALCHGKLRAVAYPLRARNQLRFRYLKFANSALPKSKCCNNLSLAVFGKTAWLGPA
jgi:hypothetical protein